MSELAAALGTTNHNLRRWARRRGLLPTAAPGCAVRLDGQQVAAIRAAWVERDAPPATPDTRTESAPAHGSGWTEALAEARTRAQTAEALAARRQAELELARADAQAAERAAADAETALAATVARLADLRAAWWRWYAQVSASTLWRRLRGHLPDVPPELLDAPRLPAPRD